MAVTWILVADHSRARLFQNVGPGKKLQKLQDIDHPDGRRHRRPDGEEDIDLHNKEEAFASEFAGQLSSLLHEGRVGNKFEKLILVASPKFLGHLKKKLDKPTTALVKATLDKDYVTLADHEIVRHLDEAFYTF